MSSRTQNMGSLAPVLLLVIAWSAAGMLANRLGDLPEYRVRREDSVLRQLFGSSTAALAEVMFFGKADGFYHRGRGTVRETAFTNSFFQVMRQEIAPVGHAHLQGGQAKEMLAWIKFAAALDPGHADYFLAASYWLGRELNRPDLALQVLVEAAELNPDSYLVHLGLGRFYAYAGERVAARRCYSEAARLWPSDADPENEDILQHKREALARLAVLAELEDRTEDALAFMSEIVRTFPQQSVLFQRRIAVLRSGQKPEESAERRWNALRRQQYEHFCALEDESGDGHDHDHDH